MWRSFYFFASTILPVKFIATSTELILLDYKISYFTLLPVNRKLSRVEAIQSLYKKCTFYYNWNILGQEGLSPKDKIVNSVISYCLTDVSMCCFSERSTSENDYNRLLCLWWLHCYSSDCTYHCVLLPPQEEEWVLWVKNFPSFADVCFMF